MPDYDRRAAEAVELRRAVSRFLDSPDRGSMPATMVDALQGVAQWATREFAQLSDTELAEVIHHLEQGEHDG